MDVTAILLSIALLVIAVIFLYNIGSKRARFVRMIDAIPGPKKVPLLGTVLDILGTPREGLFKHFDDRTRTFWPIFRTWNGLIGEVHLSKPEHIEVILSNSTHIDKSTIYEFLHPWLGKGLLTSTGSRWHSHRKLFTPTFHFKILDAFMEVFVEKSQILVEKLKKEANGKAFDISPYITHCTLDIICETAMGTAINAQEESSSDYVSSLHDIGEITLKRMLRPWLYVDFIFHLTSLGKQYKKGNSILHGFTNKVIQKRKQTILKNPTKNKSEDTDDSVLGKKKRMAFLDLLLEASDGGKVLTDVEIREEVDTFMFGGHDTTSTGISWVIYLLGRYPEVQEKVFKELDDIFQGSDRLATMRDLQEMKYLEMVIKETMRLYPSVPFIGRHAKEDINLGKYTIPAGCMISVHIYHVHHNPEHFPNPEEFNPDNFLPERIQGRHPYAYIPFSAGPRNCIGQKFAVLEEKTILSSVLRNYKVKSLEKREDLTMIRELILRPVSGIKVTLEPRNQD